MKRKRLILIALSALFLLIGGMGCEKEKEEYTGYVEGYIVGTFACYGPNQSTAERGYCILLKGSINIDPSSSMDFYTFNLPAYLFDFPEELVSKNANGDDCGPIFFPDDLRYTYKSRFKYRILGEAEKVEFACGPCITLHIPFPWHKYNEVSLKDVTKF